ncbi:MAG TPA: hypothetical protein VGG48_17105 [Rhizomicrobium sp.]|jgi:hypothetical protein
MWIVGPLVAVILLVAAILGSYLVRDFRQGEVNASQFGAFKRDKQPAAFWAWTIFNFTLLAIFATGAIALLVVRLVAEI